MSDEISRHRLERTRALKSENERLAKTFDDCAAVYQETIGKLRADLAASREQTAAVEREAADFLERANATTARWRVRATAAEREVTKLRGALQAIAEPVAINAEYAQELARAALVSPTTPAGEAVCNACDGPCEQPDERCLQCDGVNAGVWRFDGDDAICGQCGARWPKSKLSGAAPIEAPGKGEP
jgi:hypothetical protein